MREDDIDVIVATGEELPPEMWGPEMQETPMTSPMFNGEKVVDQE